METKVISSGQYTSLPASYIRPVCDRPNFSEVSDCENVPIIDLANSKDKHLIVKQIGDACQQYGFFQVINHGVGSETVEKMQKVAKEFFNLPVEEKMKLYSDDPTKTMRLSTSFNMKKETVHNWRDFLRLHCYPLDKYSPEWPSNPPSFRYWACPLERNNCGYMEWIDDPFEGTARDAIHSLLEEMRDFRMAQRVERNRMRDEYRMALQNMRNKLLICVILAAVLLTNGMYENDDDYVDYDD